MRFHPLLEPLVDKLRGPHKSIRYRFYQLPKEKLTLLWFRLTGRTWIEFYARRLNLAAGADIKRLPDESYLYRGEEFLAYLKKHGLKPEHRILDYGCGFLRAALYLVPYLNKGNYTGVDISENRIKQGIALMERAGIPSGSYEALVVSDCRLKHLEGRRFDYVWANSVLTHMPEEDIRVLLRALKRLLAPGGVFYFTFSTSEGIGACVPVQSKIKDYFYPTDYMRLIIEGEGYSFELMPDGHSQQHNSPTVRAQVR